MAAFADDVDNDMYDDPLISKMDMCTTPFLDIDNCGQIGAIVSNIYNNKNNIVKELTSDIELYINIPDGIFTNIESFMDENNLSHLIFIINSPGHVFLVEIYENKFRLISYWEPMSVVDFSLTKFGKWNDIYSVGN